MIGIARWFFFAIFVRILVLLVIGMNVRGRGNLPTSGPAIIVANHNSHLDTLVLVSLLPLSLLARTRPVAALDYFLRSKALAWFALNIIGILPINRAGGANPLMGLRKALDEGSILILYPEGSRGAPEEMIEFKRGVALLARDCPSVPVIPVFMHGLGKALPKGTKLFVPFICDVFVGEPVPVSGDSRSFTTKLRHSIEELAKQGTYPPWE
jgi:1-acyl-sn-glycerol-3-phosphate acyltransferase